MKLPATANRALCYQGGVVRAGPYGPSGRAQREAGLALFLRDPEGYRTRQEARQLKQEAAVYLTAEAVGRFLESMRSTGTTARYVGNVGFYLATWAEALAGRDLRMVNLQELLRELARHSTGRKSRITALKSFASWLREQGALSLAEYPTVSLKVPVTRPEKAMREKGYSMQARGAAPVDSHIRRAVSRACKALGIEPVRFGEYRHSFVTWASECGQEVRPKSGGLPLTAIAAVVGHHSAGSDPVGGRIHAFPSVHRTSPLGLRLRDRARPSVEVKAPLLRPNAPLSPAHPVRAWSRVNGKRWTESSPQRNELLSASPALRKRAGKPPRWRGRRRVSRRLELAFLVLLYPSSTAGPEIDRRPEWVDAQGEYEARLREVAEKSRRLMAELVPQDAEEVVPDFDSDPVTAVTAPTHWRKKTNPATGKPYTSVEEL